MLKTELRKANFKHALQVLVHDFNAFSFDDEMGGRKTFFIEKEDGETVHGEISRDCDVCFFDQPELEDKINKTINEKVLSISW